MRVKIFLLVLACVQIALLSGCDVQHVSEQVVIGSDTILIDGSSGMVKVFCTANKGMKIELRDTGAAQRMGWSLSRVGETRLRLDTGDVGQFDIYKEGSVWLVVPTGTHLSSDKTKAVKLTAEGADVVAKIGETEPPYTDMEISEQIVIKAAKINQLTVKWVSHDHAEVTDVASRVVATLHWTSPASK